MVVSDFRLNFINFFFGLKEMNLRTIKFVKLKKMSNLVKSKIIKIHLKFHKTRFIELNSENPQFPECALFDIRSGLICNIFNWKSE